MKLCDVVSVGNFPSLDAVCARGHRSQAGNPQLPRAGDRALASCDSDFRARRGDQPALGDLHWADAGDVVAIDPDSAHRVAALDGPSRIEEIEPEQSVVVQVDHAAERLDGCHAFGSEVPLTHFLFAAAMLLLPLRAGDQGRTPGGVG